MHDTNLCIFVHKLEINILKSTLHCITAANRFLLWATPTYPLLPHSSICKLLLSTTTYININVIHPHLLSWGLDDFWAESKRLKFRAIKWHPVLGLNKNPIVICSRV